MIRICLFLLFSFISTSQIFAQEGIHKGNLVWYDEFNGTGIPDIEKWDRPEYNRRNNNNGPDGWWSRQDSYLDGNGNLVIRVRKINNKNSDADPYDYSVGAIRSKGKFEKLYGVFEINCKLPTRQGWWVAFWMMQGNVGSEINGGVDGSEVDVMEGFGWTDKINQAIHWDGYGDAHKSTGKKTEVPGIRDGFHTYTMVWNPEEYIFYIDGKETWRTQGGGVCNKPGYLKITGELSTEDWAINEYWSKDPAQAVYPDSFIVDYVKVYELPVEELPPIRELVSHCYPNGNLVVGTACHEHYLGTQTEEIINREFSYMTPASDFKQSYIHPEPGVWRWEKSDKWISHCRENNQVIRLHAPISPQVSSWAKDDSRTAEELEQNLVEYMKAVCQRYNETEHVKWLDVVNETVYHTDGSWFGPKPGNDSWENPWPVMGYDETHELRPPVYIKKAFEVANEYGSNLKLIINQHGGMSDAIWDKIKGLVIYLRQNNLRVDGIGWQAHEWLGWEKEEGNMQRLSDLIDWCHQNDLEFHITEFNVWLKQEDLGKLTEQAETFHAITRLAAEKSKNGFIGINFWHIRAVETQNKDRDGSPWAEDYQPKEAYFRIKEAICEASTECSGNCGVERLYKNIDFFDNGSSLNLLNGEWEHQSDAHSISVLELNSLEGYSGSGAKFEWTLNKGAVIYPWSLVKTWLSPDKKVADLSAYHAIVFKARGVGLIDVGLMTSHTEAGNDHFLKRIRLKDQWQTFVIPFSELDQLWSSRLSIDLMNGLAIVFRGAGDFGIKGEMWIDNIQLVNKNAVPPVEPDELPEPAVFYQPKVNQLGYLPGAVKIFTITADSVTSGQRFSVVDNNGSEVYSGNLENLLVDDSEISGEKVYRGNFTSFNQEGFFRIKSGTKTSFPFRIHSQVYDSLLFYSLKAFNLLRANNPVNDQITGLAIPAGHTEDAHLPDNLGNIVDVAGGWYNGGDFGKRVPPTVFACAHLMNLYEVNPGYFLVHELSQPEDDNNLPALLSEIKAGLDWLLQMQRSDGAVYHKVSSDPHVAYGYGPGEDPHSRMLNYQDNFSTTDAAGFTAIIARAARVYAPFDSLFAEQCRQAAMSSWSWVQKNRGIGQQDDFYPDLQSWQQELWAKAEMFMLTADLNLLKSYYEDLFFRSAAVPHWSQPHAMSLVQLFKHPEIPSAVKTKIKQQIENLALQLKSTVDKSGYGSAVGKFDWRAGSNAHMANAGAVFIYAFQITGNKEWLQYASQQLDYLLGRNSLNFSFVTGFGENSCHQPYHWINKAYGIVPDGMLVNGASIQNTIEEAKLYEVNITNFPPAKSYIATSNSRLFNETGIYTVSSLAYLAGYLAVNDRKLDVTRSPRVIRNEQQTLQVDGRDFSLYCYNCRGKTDVSLYSINGQLLKKESALPEFRDSKITGYHHLIHNHPIILFKVSDETGRTKSGKITRNVSF
jgi:endo-1,4-beta-xylanase